MDTFLHDPNAKAVYGFDWSDWLTERGTTISTATWTVPVGLTKISSYATDTTSAVYISGGTAKTQYLVTCHIVCANSLEDDRSFFLNVKER